MQGWRNRLDYRSALPTARRLASQTQPAWLQSFRLTSSERLLHFVARHTQKTLGRRAADGLRHSCRCDRLSAVPGLQRVGGSHPSRLYGRPLLVAVRRIAAAARKRDACRAGVCRDPLLRLCLDDRARCGRATAAPAAGARLGAVADAALLVPVRSPLGARCSSCFTIRRAGRRPSTAGKDLALGRIGALLNGFQR